jgi:hypothetical protein
MLKLPRWTPVSRHVPAHENAGQGDAPMLSIILSACLVTHPDQCRDFKIPLDVTMDPLHCAMAAPPYFAQWAEEHPQWQIRRWKCQPVTMDNT